MISETTPWIELIPAGTFSTNDGRGPFYNDDPHGVVARTRAAMRGGLVIDADHATDRAAPQGLPAPAMGWIRELRVVAGAIQGRVEWTVRGAAAFKAKEYRFVSPAFEFDPPQSMAKDAQTGGVVRILRAALTNNPALSQLPAIAASRLPVTMAQRLKQIERQVALERREKMSERTFNGVTLTDDELAVCRQFGNDPAQFAKLLADRRAGRPMVLSSRTTNRGENAPSGIIGPPIVGEAIQEHREEIGDESVDSRRLVMEAQKSLGEFLAHAAAPDSWKVLARASALLVGALDRIAPPYADRVNPRAGRPGENGSQWR